MAKRIQRVMAGVAAMASLALGGAVFAQAHASPAHPVHQHAVVRHAVRSADGDNVQSGDQSTPDRPGATAESGESSGTESPEQSGEAPASQSDGPGGHADAPGANVDHRFQGNE